MLFPGYTKFVFCLIYYSSDSNSFPEPFSEIILIIVVSFRVEIIRETWYRLFCSRKNHRKNSLLSALFCRGIAASPIVAIATCVFIKRGLSSLGFVQ